MLPRIVAAVLALGFLVVPAPPEAAQAATTDFESRARCYSRTIGGGPTKLYWECELRRILTTAPKVYGLRAGQTVGWRFIVERRIGEGSWSVRYRSPIQKASASPTKRASFSAMDVKVVVPPGSGYEVMYRVAVKAFWYRPDGTVQRSQKQAVQTYALWIDGKYRWKESGCAGIAAIAA